jgi:N-acetyl-beta-hexosaminidase
VLFDDVPGLPISQLARKGASVTSSSPYTTNSSIQEASDGGDGEVCVNTLMTRNVYSLDDLRGLVAYADDRGIEVVPEIDVPSHAL